ncbi:hypothetical protein C7974DRAFT_165700 [Boeremia exigua]|uniref:uncharacterized protein n=1 Tax=Boeremia exigua TaxID=749465 RepID=UPI001E8DADCE|nr:uncharacterized protein C7974DRAFT_165700 [Boeremia exigua]KAH6633138.1 hypothetical protein C7974DRAFT_165700 [Boeremia exigua]
MSIPVMLIRMANFTMSRAIVNTTFKSLSAFVVTIAITRLAFLCDAESQNADYTTTIFWLMVEAAVALIAASVSSYRVVLLDVICKRQVQRSDAISKDGWKLMAWWRRCGSRQDRTDSTSVILCPIN